jgi:hypothetical protein
VVPRHSDADRLPILQASIRALYESVVTNTAEPPRLHWKCTVYVTAATTDSTYVQTVTQALGPMCTVELSRPDGWVRTVQTAIVNDHNAYVALLSDATMTPSSLSQLNAMAWLATMTRANLNVASSASSSLPTNQNDSVPSKHSVLPSTLPRARCLAHATQYVDFLASPWTVFTAPVFRCLQRNLAPSVNEYAWGYDVTLADACPEARIGIVNTPLVTTSPKQETSRLGRHAPCSLNATSDDCRDFFSCTQRAQDQMVGGIQHAVANVSSRVQALEYYQHVAHVRPTTLPYCRLVQFRLLNRKQYTSHPHRGGWTSVIAGLNASGYIDLSPSASTATTVLMLDFIEYWFRWGKKAIKEPWVGFAHLLMQQDLPKHLSGDVLDTILEEPSFRDSAKKCLALFVFTTTMATRITSKLDSLGLPSIPICVVPHPIGVEANVTKFDALVDLEAALSNTSAVVMLGKQYRRIASLHRLRTHRLKVWLPSVQDPLLSGLVASELAAENVTLDPRVEIRRLASHADYDTFVRQNIILIDMWSAGANNAVLEGMALQAPFLVRRLDGPMEFLGADYPLFFDSLDQVQYWLDHEDVLRQKMRAAHEYLARLDTSSFTVEYLGQQMVQCTTKFMAAWPQPHQEMVPIKDNTVLVRDGRQVCDAWS